MNEPNGWRWLPVSVAVIVLDQITKHLIVGNFELYERIEVLPVLDITRLHNTGAAFSMLATASGWQRWLFTALALGVGVAIIIWLGRLKARTQGLLACSLALILGGALGNLIDRLWHGHVVDFIHVHWGDAYFPAFNVADSAITVGAGLLLLDALLEGRRARARAGGNEAAR
ncbi:MAG: lipoprotein signal peptidase [Steroidobacteraceae bacterium]|jgi:signal peptidase II|nr:lipoprotein signal peptidase [Steroidobacteraceae bacterium]